MSNLHRYVRPFRTPSLRRLPIYRPIPLLIFAAASLLLSAVLTHAQDVRDSVFSRKADCTLVGPFAGVKPVTAYLLQQPIQLIAFGLHQASAGEQGPRRSIHPDRGAPAWDQSMRAGTIRVRPVIMILRNRNGNVRGRPMDHES